MSSESRSLGDLLTRPLSGGNDVKDAQRSKSDCTGNFFSTDKQKSLQARQQESPSNKCECKSAICRSRARPPVVAVAPVCRVFAKEGPFW